MPDNLWANKAFVSRVIRKFQLEGRPREPESPLFLPFILPVTSMDELLVETKIKTVTVAHIVGQTESHRVPAGKRWAIKGFDLLVMSGDRTISAIYLFNATGDVFTYKDSIAAASYKSGIVLPVIMEPDWYLKILGAGGTSDGTVRSRMLVEESDAY